MRILIVGATGSLGTRLIPTLLAQKHQVIAFVRNPSKLTSILPALLHQRIETTTGDAEDINALKSALVEQKCDGVICVAGSPSSPFGSEASRQGYIGRAVALAAREVGESRGKPLRGWWLAGIIFMDVPGMQGKTFHDFWPSFRPEHILTIRTLQSIPASSLAWSIYCPSRMTIGNPQIVAPSSSSSSASSVQTKHRLTLSPDSPPGYQLTGLLMYIPYIGMILEIMFMAFRYTTVMEDVAEMMAVEFGKERWVGKLVGGKAKRV